MYQNVIFLSDGNGGDIVTASENFHMNGIRLTSVALGSPDLPLMKEIIGNDRDPPLLYRNYFFQHSDAANLASAAMEMRREILNCSGANNLQ